MSEEQDKEASAAELVAGIENAVAAAIADGDRDAMALLKQKLWEHSLPHRGSLAFVSELLDRYGQGLTAEAINWVRVRRNTLEVMLDLFDRSIARLDEFL